MSHHEQNPHSRKVMDYEKKTRPNLKALHPHRKTIHTAKQIDHQSERQALNQALHIGSTEPLTEEQAWQIEDRTLVAAAVHQSSPPPPRSVHENLREHVGKSQSNLVGKSTLKS